MKTLLMIVAILSATLAFPTRAATREEAMAAGGRAMDRFDATTKLWLRTQDPKTQQIVLCSALQATADTEGLAALDCYAAAKDLTPAKNRAIADSLERYQAGFGYVYPTANDVARVPKADRSAVHQAIGCQRIRDRIALQVELMKRGSTGYWNMDQMQAVERQQCGENMAVAP
jgi:hypothetical protein